jgi:hypothetical protein
MNRVLSHAEKVFEGLGLHKEAGIPLVVGADERGSVRKRTKQHSLRWQLLNGRWQMVVETRQQAKGGGTFTSTIPLLCTSRQTRVEALGLIKEFHAALVAASSV